MSCLLSFSLSCFHYSYNHSNILPTLITMTLIQWNLVYIAQKMKFSIKDSFSKCDQLRRKLRIWSHLLKKSLMGNFIFLCSLESCPYLIHCVKYTRIRSLSGPHISVFRLNLGICELPDHSDWKVIDCLHRLFQLKIGTCGFRFSFAEVLNLAFDSLFWKYVQYILLREWFLDWKLPNISKIHLIPIAELCKMSSPLLAANQTALKCFRKQIKLNPKGRATLISQNTMFLEKFSLQARSFLHEVSKCRRIVWVCLTIL